MSSPATADVRRLFFALWPDDEVRERIEQAAHRIVRKSGKPVPRDNLHITLAFLGAVDAERRACLEAAADAIRVEPFSVTLEHVGHWPKPRILWMGPAVTPPPLLQLARAIAAILPGCGIEPETRPFAVHLTLARKVARAIEAGAVDPIEWSARDFVLVQSITEPGGSVYRVLRRWPLVV